MNEKPSEVLGALPHTRPHRRSDKRAAKAVTASAHGAGTPRPAGARKRSTKPTPGRVSAQRASQRTATAETQSGADSRILSTAVEAAAELAEIGLSVTARALRGAVSRLPRP